MPDVDGTLPLDARRTNLYAARWIATLLEPHYRYAHEANEWLRWDGHRWASESTAVPAVGDAIDRIQRHIADSGEGDMWKWAARLGDKVKPLTEAVSHDPRLRVAALDLDTHDRVLATPNGDLHLWDDGTWSLQPSDPTRLITRTLRVAPAERYDTSCRFARWLAWFTGEDGALADYLADVCAACLAVERTQLVHVLEGPGGNGKTTFGNLLRHVFGTYAAVTPRGLLTTGRDTVTDELAALRGVRLLVDEESRSGDRLDEAKVKALTGSEHLTVRHLYGRYHEIRWVGGILHLTNALPAVEDMSDGMWRRLRRIVLNARIDMQDRTLEHLLREDAPHVLTWVLAGYERLAQGTSAAPETVRSATDEYRRESDHVAEFVEERCHTAPTLTVEAAALWRAWAEWCADTHNNAGTQTTLGRRLTALGYPAGRDMHRRYRSGLGLRAPEGQYET